MNWLKTILEVGGFKKFVISFAATALISLNNKIGLGLDEATIQHVVEVVVAFLILQTFADHSKQTTNALANSAPVKKEAPVVS